MFVEGIFIIFTTIGGIRPHARLIEANADGFATFSLLSI